MEEQDLKKGDLLLTHPNYSSITKRIAEVIEHEEYHNGEQISVSYRLKVGKHIFTFAEFTEKNVIVKKL